MSSTFTTETLRQKLVGILDGLQTGEITPAQAHAVVKVSNTIIESAKLELEVAKTKSVLDKQNSGVIAGPLLLSSGDSETIENSPRVVEEIKQGPDPKIVMAHYDDGVRPAQIARLVGSDIRTVTEMINSNK